MALYSSMMCILDLWLSVDVNLHFVMYYLVPMISIDANLRSADDSA